MGLFDQSFIQPMNGQPKVGMQAPGPPSRVGVAAAKPAAPAPLPAWAHEQAVKGGGNPANYAMMGNAMVGKGPVDPRPGTITPAGQKILDQSRVGVQAPPEKSIAPVANIPGAAASGPISAQGPAPADPARQMILSQMRNAQWNTQHNGQRFVNDGSAFGHFESQGHEANFNQAANSLANYDSGQAQRLSAANQDPRLATAALREILANPQTRAAYLGEKGVNPGQVPLSPGEAIHAGNLDQFLGQSENAGLAGALNGPDGKGADLLSTIQGASRLPGFEDAHSQNRQAFNAWVQRRHPTQQAWDEEVGNNYSYANPETTKFLGMPMIGSGLSWMGPRGGIGDSIAGHTQNHQNSQALHDLVNRYHINPYGQ